MASIVVEGDYVLAFHGFHGLNRCGHNLFNVIGLVSYSHNLLTTGLRDTGPSTGSGTPNLYKGKRTLSLSKGRSLSGLRVQIYAFLPNETEFDQKSLFLCHKNRLTMNETDLSPITTFIFDFDGVMTDGTVFCDFEGHPLRATNVKDGYAIQLATKLGYNVAVISGAVCPSTIVRMNSLGVTDVFTGIPDKVLKLKEYMNEKGLKPEEIVFMGDDIPDLNVMKEVGLPACPADAVPEVKAISKFISERPGGKGAVRDLIERTLKVQGKWMTAEAYSW